MFSINRLIVRFGIIALLATSFVAVRAVYVPTNRDTKEPPEEVVYDITEPTDLEFLYETTHFKYYFRESRDTIAIYDKRNNYTWKTGLDLEYARDIDDQCDDVLDLYEEQFEDVDLSTFGSFVFDAGTTGSTGFGLIGEAAFDVEDLTDTMAANDVSFTINDLSLVQGEQYRLSFDAYARESRDIQVTLASDVDEVVTLPTEATTFTFDFTLTDATAADFSLAFLLANVGGDITETTVFLDNIRIEEFDGTDVVADSDVVGRGDFELLQAELTTTDDDLLAACRPKEVRLNTTYTGFANSLLTIEYYDLSNNIKRLSSAGYEDVESQLMTVSGDPGHYRLDVEFDEIDLQIKLHVYFTETGVEYEIRDDEITGDDVDVLAAVILSPFLGASGGAYEEFDLAELDYGDDEIFKYKIPGYSLVPDGSGTLIRFEDNDVKLDSYEGQVYGINYTQNQLHYNYGEEYVPFKQPSMPVFGMAHGDQQAAFVAYASSGDEHMEIIAMPEDNLTYYNFTYPRFEYNKQYLQVYNKSGWGFLTLYEDRNHFDIRMHYDFLAGDGSTGPAADYVGMAKAYRQYLIDDGQLTEFTPDYDDIPIRLDFFMSDVEKAVTGYTNMVTTSAEGVDRVLAEILGLGISNINAGLIGWNDGGRTLGDPRDVDFSRDIGRKRDFEDLIRSYDDQGIDISFHEDYVWINEEMMTLRRNAARHTSTWYSWIDTFDYPVGIFYFARPVKSIEWFHDQIKEFDDLGVQSYSVAGMTELLLTDYTDDTSRADAKQILIDGFAAVPDDKLINAYQPNSFLWAYTDRYIGAPVYGTQFLIETDTVPFLQLVLHGTMEVYGPYSNFSFYTDADVLRMIDYNVYPNFVLSENPAYLLTDTNSRSFYSMQYELYEELIESIYNRVNTALAPTLGAEWVSRTVVENGIIVNHYDNGVDVIINYTQDAYTYNGDVVFPESFLVVGD